MDEPTGNQQGNLTSGGESGSTSGEEAPTLTASEARAMTEKARSDALAEVGRHKKAAEQAMESMQTVERRLSQIEEERFNAELENARDDTDKTRDIRRRQADSKRRNEVEERERKVSDKEAEFNGKLERVEASERRDLAKEVATELNVDSSVLVKFGGLDRESMVELAKTLPQAGTSVEGEGKARMTYAPDSGKTRGGGSGIPTNKEEFSEWVDNLSVEDYTELKPAIDEARKKDLIK